MVNLVLKEDIKFQLIQLCNKKMETTAFLVKIPIVLIYKAWKYTDQNFEIKIWYSMKISKKTKNKNLKNQNLNKNYPNNI